MDYYHCLGAHLQEDVYKFQGDLTETDSEEEWDANFKISTSQDKVSSDSVSMKDPRSTRSSENTVDN